MKFRKWHPFLGLLLVSMSSFVNAAGDADAFIDRAILGSHPFTLQWINDANALKPGEIIFVRDGNEIIAKGYQEEPVSNGVNFMEFEGKVKVINPRELRITGSLITRVDHIAGGEALLREGEFIFKAHGQRQYWRMQNMRVHEVTDYVDIHFKK
ncbi:hypothetical protein [Vibrio sp. LaRot3]|uniref:hypothetical protein n=1 Tax=Vibrio sp. LaRot3 TaxID=2998829 RepID=UPI0022CDE6E3|nr:hypothetical protein [Vibrio sp. LaRot3]MDA0147108.1 hypothetical protein [Vibrio sp. LaRot3]